MSRQQRTIKPRRKPGLSEQPQYEAIVWSVGAIEGQDIILIPDYPMDGLFLNGIPKLRAVLSDQLPIYCEAEEGGFRCSYFAPINPGERFRMAAEDNAIRNQFGGRLAPAELFAVREFVPFDWEFYSRNSENSISLIRTSGAGPIGVYAPPALKRDGDDAVPTVAYPANDVLVLGWDTEIYNGDTLTLEEDAPQVRDWDNGYMLAKSIMVTA